MKNINIFFNELRLNAGAIWLDNEIIKFSAPEKFQNQESNDFIKNNRSQILSILKANLIFSKEKFLNAIILKNTTLSYYPLSSAQERLWFIEQYEQGTNAYHIPEVYELEINTDVEGIKHALKQVVLRHEVLRSTIEQLDNQEYATQLVHNDPLPIEETSLTDKDDYVSIIRKDINRPFDLSSEYPIRIKLYTIQSDHADIEKPLNKILLLINTHHIASDGWSANIFHKELIAYYEAYINKKTDFSLPVLEIQYKDYAVWQKAYLIKETLEKQLSYWKTRLSGYQTLEMPTDYARSNEIDYSGANQTFVLDKSISKKLRALVQRYGTTLHSVMLASINILLSKYTGQDDIVIGSPIANRHHRQTEGLIGFFVNTQANRTSLNNMQSYESLIQQVHQEQVEAQMHQDLPLEKLIDELGVTRDTSRHPIFQIMFSAQGYDNHGKDQEQQKDNYLTPYKTKGTYKVAKFDLSIFIGDNQEELTGIVNYATGLFHKDTIARFIQHYKHLLAQLTEVPGKPYSQFSLAGPEEYRQIMHQWSSMGKEYPKDKTIYQLFQEQVERTPENIALVYEEQKLTYKELNEKSNQLARHIRAHYQQRTGQVLPGGAMIALYLDRGQEMVIGILAVMKAGGAYVPMDTNYPQERIDYILKDTGVRFVLSLRHLCYGRKTSLPQGKVIHIDMAERLYQEWDTSNLLTYSGKTDLAYVIYTSGSTGIPKGVPISHKNLCPLMYWGFDVIKLLPGDRVLQNLSYYFDWSVWEIFITLTSGASLFVVSKELLLNPSQVCGFVNSKQITIIHGTPSWFNTVLQDGMEIGSLRMLIPGAEKLSVEMASRFLDHVGENCRVFNMYGPTEATIMASVYEVDRARLSNYKTLQSMPIGSPIANSSLVVLDKDMNLCPVNVPGELYISGDSVSVGYLNDAEKTKKLFVPNIFKELRGDILYKTGDLVRWLSDGKLEFIGRNDDQVKIRGFRIELGEIEQALLQIPGIRQCCVLGKERKTETDSNKYLVAYYVADNNCETHTQAGILDKLSQTLPEYMVPRALVVMEFFPLTINGKLDKRALPDPDFSLSTDEYVAPTNEMETEICRIWQEILGLDKVGIADDFFSIGGNSILAIQVSHRMSKVLGYDIRVADVFRLKSIDEILSVKEQYFGLVKPYHSKYCSDLADMVFISPGRAGSEMYQDLAEMLSKKYNCLGIDNYNIHNKKKISSLNKLANYYLSEYEQKYNIKETVNLLGWSLGGQIALEIGGILEARGHKNINIFLLDTYIIDEVMQNLASLTEHTECDIKQERKKLSDKYGAEYFEKVISTIDAENEIINTSISKHLIYSNVILFSANQKNFGTNTANYKLLNEHYISLKSNNIDLVANNLNIIVLDCDHFNIIDTNKETISNFIISNLVFDKVS